MLSVIVGGVVVLGIVFGVPCILVKSVEWMAHS